MEALLWGTHSYMEIMTNLHVQRDTYLEILALDQTPSQHLHVPSNMQRYETTPGGVLPLEVPCEMTSYQLHNQYQLVPVLCEQYGLPVCNQMLPNSYKSLCVLWDQMYEMRRGPWSLIIAIIRLMCFLALNKVYHVRCNPYQCGTSMRVATWPRNIDAQCALQIWVDTIVAEEQSYHLMSSAGS